MFDSVESQLGKVTPMPWSALISLAALLVASFAAHVAKSSARSAAQSAKAAGRHAELTESALIQQTLFALHRDYRSPEMLYAVEHLWGFLACHGPEHIREAYREQCLADERWADAAIKRGERNLDAITRTLDFQRRLVSDFYLQLAELRVHGVLPDRIIYTSWAEPDLRIIPEVLIPMAEELTSLLKTPPAPAVEALRALYQASRTYRR